MKHLTPTRIAKITGGELVGDMCVRDIVVKGAVKDNREVTPSCLFVCIRGARADGHTFANSAFEEGAACCLAEQTIPNAIGPYVLVESTLEAVKKLGAYHRSLFDIPVIGVTGSVGKTTTKEMTAAVLSSKHKVLKTPKNHNNELGVPLTLLSLDSSHGAAVIEMGISESGEMSRLAEMVRPTISIITKIGYSHLNTLGDLAGVLRAKTEIFDFMDSSGLAVLSGDDDLLWEYDPGMRKVTFGLDERNDFRAENISTDKMEKVLFDIVHESGRFPACIPSYGGHLAIAALAAAATGRALGLTDEEISCGFLSYLPVEGRANVRETGYITLIDDCYNANPDSVMTALESLSALPRRRVAILGDMLNLGGLSDSMHREIGAFAARRSIDCLICCGDMAALVYEGYTSSGGNEAHYYPDKEGLISAIMGLIKKEDAVLVKASHGMKFEELLPVISRLRE